MNVINDCKCNEEETSAECTGLCANAEQFREAKRQELKSKLTRAKDKRSADTNGDSEDSITSVGTDDLEYLMKFEELMTFEYQAKQQFKELKRWEHDYIKKIQTKRKVRSSDKNTKIDELHGQLEAKSLANQQLAERIRELEGQVGTLKSKLQHCNEQVAQLTEEQRDGASKLAEKRLDVDRQTSGINIQGPTVKDKEVNAKPIIFDVSLESDLDKTDYQEVAVNAGVPTTSKNSQTPTQSIGHAVEKSSRAIIRKWSDDPERILENVESVIQFKENQSAAGVSGAQQMESFIEDSSSAYQHFQKKVSKLDQTRKNDTSHGVRIPKETQQSGDLNLLRIADIYDEMSLKEFRQVSQIIDSNFEESKNENTRKTTAGGSNVFELNREELEKWLKNIFDALLIIRTCQTCSMVKGQMVEVCEAICYKLGIRLLNDDGKKEKANEIEMRELIEYQIQDGEASAGVIEKEISAIGNHSEELLTDQIDSTHSTGTHSLIKKASKLAKLQLSVKPIDSAIGTSIPSEKEATKTHSNIPTGEEFIDSLELSSLHSPVGTSTPIRKKRPEVIRLESLEKSLDLSRQPLKVVKNQETLSESPTKYEGPDKVLKSTQTDYKSMESTKFQTKIDINESVQVPWVSEGDFQVKISSDPSGHIDQANSGAGRTLAPEIKSIIKGEGEIVEHSHLGNIGISQDIQNLKNKPTTKMNSFEYMQALNDKNVARDMEQKIDENKRKKRIKEDREIKGMKDDGKEENESLSKIIRGKEKTQFLKKKNSTHDKEPITPWQSTSNSQEITKSSSIIHKTPHCICQAMQVSRQQYEQAIAAKKKKYCLKTELSILQNDRTDENQKVKRGRQENLTTTLIASVETSTHRRDRTSSRYQADFACDPCDCSPCGSRIESDEIGIGDQKSRLKNSPTVGDRKNQGVLAKIHSKSRRVLQN